MRTMKLLAVLSAAVLVSGCANIGMVNGLRMKATKAPDSTYC
jgi:outer membrane murein-binding lipoprotein Lpp